MENLKIWELICAIPDAVLREVMLSWYRFLCKGGALGKLSTKVQSNLFIFTERALSESANVKKRLRFMEKFLSINGSGKKLGIIQSNISLVLSKRATYIDLYDLRYCLTGGQFQSLIEQLIDIK